MNYAAMRLRDIASTPTVAGWQRNTQTSYTLNQNPSMEYALSHNTIATVAYVDSEAGHLAIFEFAGASTELLPPV